MIWLKAGFWFLVLVRGLRWLSILQQKEYRFDRFWLFVNSDDGKRELARLLVIPLRLNQLRRPKMTVKAGLLLGLLLTQVLFLTLSSFWMWLVAYLLIPVLLMINNLIMIVPTYLIGWYWSKRASLILKKKKPVIVGITGSYGKTTTKLLIKALLKEKYSVWATPKSFNTWISVSRSIRKSYKGEEVVLIEYAAYKKGEIARLVKLFKPTVGVVTGITGQHLGLFGSKQKLIEAKSELLEVLDDNSVVVFNATDKEVVKMVKKYKKLDLRAATKVSLDGTKLVGDFYEVNVGIAVDVAKEFGIDDKRVAKALKSFSFGEEFVRIKKTKEGATLIIDDKTSNPKGFEAIVGLAKKMEMGKKTLVTYGIVDLGVESESVHKRLASKAVKVFDFVVHTSELESEVLKKELSSKYKDIVEAKELRRFINENVGKGDLIVLEGKISPHLKKVIMDL